MLKSHQRMSVFLQVKVKLQERINSNET
jgi:hypothetical protein